MTIKMDADWLLINCQLIHTAKCLNTPRIDTVFNEIAEYKVYNKLDLESAYHYVVIKEEEKLWFW